MEVKNPWNPRRDPQRDAFLVSSISCTAALVTASAPGAIAIVHLTGDIEPVLWGLTGIAQWPFRRLRLATFDGIDEGIAVRLAQDVAQVMPHGGMRVAQRVMERLAEMGVNVLGTEAMDPRAMYPETKNVYEAIAAAALARAASPLAIEPLLAAPRIWRTLRGTPLTNEERDRSARLNRLIAPPRVVLAGPPNVGKSTLSNALLGRSMSIALDLPGTTRDYTAAVVELAGLVVQWHDTPGICMSGDPIEKKSIEVARRLIDQADLLIAIADAKHDWFDASQLPRAPGLRVASKSDLGRRNDGDLEVSAVTGAGMAELVLRVRDTLVPPEDLTAAMHSRWMFDPRLDRTCE